MSVEARRHGREYDHHFSQFRGDFVRGRAEAEGSPRRLRRARWMFGALRGGCSKKDWWMFEEKVHGTLAGEKTVAIPK